MEEEKISEIDGFDEEALLNKTAEFVRILFKDYAAKSDFPGDAFSEFKLEEFVEFFQAETHGDFDPGEYFNRISTLMPNAVKLIETLCSRIELNERQKKCSKGT